ncbi:peptidoglycan peptidase [Thioclava litoralis]|uniref:Peptidoglycan peptidase n=1 Tax=Thioclava litoralis TaxID=3076557 RepID=A0ABZ1DYM3_9RHOB|nr:peptidoglycan peptidase [Thioclava sp. FTW29]
MNRFFPLFAILLPMTFASALAAQETDWAAIMAETAWDWHPGDLVFRNGLNAFDDTLRQAQGAEWASVGIMRASSGSPRVVYADEVEGVTEVMVEQFLDGLDEGDYAVYRIEALDPNRTGKQMEQGPIAEFVLRKAYEAPFDPWMQLGNGRYYNAELPYRAALAAGVDLGPLVPLRKVAARNDAVKALLLQDWRANPACQPESGITTKAACWDAIADGAVITTDGIRNSAAVTRIFPN